MFIRVHLWLILFAGLAESVKVTQDSLADDFIEYEYTALGGIGNTRVTTFRVAFRVADVQHTPAGARNCFQH